MSCYSIPALTFENEFANLTWLGQYVDKLVTSTGDQDYAVVYEWDDEGPGDWPPVAVLLRVDGQWHRRLVLVTVERAKDGACRFGLELADVNGH